MFLCRSFTILLLITTVFCSCTRKVDENEKAVNLLISSKVKGMDPIMANDTYSSNEVARVYEGLLEYHYLKRPFELIPNLAEAMPKISDKGLTYTFKIKKGIFFHDDKAFSGGVGREVEAKDFVYSIKRLANPKLASLGWWVLDGKLKGLNEWRKKYIDGPQVDYDEKVEGVQAIDKYTLQFKLIKPYPQFLYALAMPFTFVVAKEVVDFYGQEFLNHPVGTGPFTLPQFTQGNKIIYFKNKKFRKKLFPKDASPEFVKKGLLQDAGKQLPLVDKLIVHIIRESQPRWLNFLRGKVDVLGIPKDNFDTVITPNRNLDKSYIKKGISLHITPSLDVTYVAFNHDLKLFKNNKKLRQAISLAYDVNKTNELFYNKTALPAQSIIPPGISGYQKNFKNPYRGPDIIKAKKLLKEAGYPDGKGLPEITYDTSSGTVSRQMGESFKKYMQKIGISVKVRTNPWPELQKKIQKRDVMLWGIAWNADYPDAENFLQLLYSKNRTPGPNGSGYSNPVFDKLYEKISVMHAGKKRTALYKKMSKMVTEEAPWIFGVHRQSYVLTHKWFKNYIYSNFDQGRAQYLNIDMKQKREMLNKVFK